MEIRSFRLLSSFVEFVERCMSLALYFSFWQLGETTWSTWRCGASYFGSTENFLSRRECSHVYSDPYSPSRRAIFCSAHRQKTERNTPHLRSASRVASHPATHNCYLEQVRANDAMSNSTRPWGLGVATDSELLEAT